MNNDEYIQYEIYEIFCRPLGRTRYRFSEIRTKKLSESSESTTALLKQVREKERKRMERSGVLTNASSRPAPDETHNEYTSALSTTSESYAAFAEESVLDLGSAAATAASVDRPEAQPYEPRLKRLRAKISDAVFDYSEIEQEQIEQSIDELVNADGYYNEVEPDDIDVEYKKESKFNKTTVAMVIGLIIYLIILMRM